MCISITQMLRNSKLIRFELPISTYKHNKKRHTQNLQILINSHSLGMVFSLVLNSVLPETKTNTLLFSFPFLFCPPPSLGGA